MKGSEQKRAFLAVILSGIVLFGWQTYFAPSVDLQDEVREQAVVPAAKVQENLKEVNVVNKAVNVSSQLFEVKSPKHSVVFGNDFSFKNYESSNAVFEFGDILGVDSSFKIQVIDNNNVKDIAFGIMKDSTDVSFKGFDPALGIEMQGILLDNGKFSVSLRSKKPYRFRVSIQSSEASLDNRQVRQFLFFGKEVDRVDVSSDETAEGNYKWLALDFNYHIFSMIFKDKQLAKYTTTEKGLMVFDTLTETNDFSSDFVFAKKNYDDLAKLGDKMELSVDFGIFGIIAVPILRGLQFVHKYIPNYGLALIVLTILIRLILFPLQFKSFKSMKKMQKIQPELKSLREKFKDDPQRMQKETMSLFKKSGANPMSGCLPLVAQMPVFFAFYQVLYNAVELVGAPFAFWITDLSIKDPYYVLPVLMGIAFFFQTKLNPSQTIDPAQQKIMAIMPLFFCFIMKDLPAGLNLYIFVSTVFGISQQLFVYKLTD